MLRNCAIILPSFLLLWVSGNNDVRSWGMREVINDPYPRSIIPFWMSTAP
ncbi:hypothetical protein ACVWY3_005826 [Bradyrhizobium sp. USDA 4486]